MPVVTDHRENQESERVDPATDDPRLEQRHRDITKTYEEYVRNTLDKLGAASADESRQLMQWVHSMEMTEEAVSEREKWWQLDYRRRQESAITLYEFELLGQLHRARDQKLISRQSVDRWVNRFKNHSVHYKRKEDFVRYELPKYIENAKKAMEQRQKLLKDPTMAMLDSADVTDLKSFVSEEAFLNLHYKKKIDLLAAMKAALAAKKKGMSALHTQAKSILDGAVSSKALSSTKVGRWMKRIFEKDVSEAKIRSFLSSTLPGMVDNWKDASKRFHELEKKCEGNTTIRGFHFVSFEVFLGWKYDKKETYLNEAEHRFADIRDEPYQFLKIRHALDCKDWDEAQELIDRVKEDVGSGSLLMSKEARGKLDSMEKYLTAHQPRMWMKNKGKENPEDIVNEMRNALSLVRYPWIKERFLRAMHLGYDTLWAYCTMNFNWDWCRKRGYSSDEIDANLRARAKQETYDHIRHGQPKGHVNNDMTSNTSVTPAPRWDSDTNSAQAIHVDHSTSNATLIDEFVHKNRHNRSVWYWTRLMEKNVPFGEMKYIIDHVQPILKRGMRKLDSMGVRFTETGPLAYKNAGALKYANGMAPKKN